MTTLYTGIRRNEDPYGGRVQNTLYNYWAASLAGFGINGWHVPTRDDYEYLFNYIDDSYTDNNWLYAGLYLKQIGLANWDYYVNVFGNDTFSFEALGVGIRDDDGVYNGLRKQTGFWTTTSASADAAHFIELLYSSNRIEDGGVTQKRDGLSIRLIKNDSTAVTSVTDNDGNTYRCTKIGSQVWMRDNFAGRKLIDNSPLVEIRKGSDWAALTQPAYCYFNDNRPI